MTISIKYQYQYNIDVLPNPIGKPNEGYGLSTAHKSKLYYLEKSTSITNCLSVASEWASTKEGHSENVQTGKRRGRIA